MRGGGWVRCYRCGGKASGAEVRRRQALTSVQTVTTWWGFPLCRTKHYELVDLCSLCDEQEAAAVQRKRQYLGVALGAVGVVVFGWSTRGLLSALGVGATVLLYALSGRRAKRSLVLPNAPTQGASEREQQ